MCVAMCLWVQCHGGHKKGSDPPGAGVIGGCLLPIVGPGIQILVFWKSSKCSELMRHLSGSIIWHGTHIVLPYSLLTIKENFHNNEMDVCVLFSFYLHTLITQTHKKQNSPWQYMREGNDTKGIRQFAREIIGGDWPRKLLPLWDVIMKLAIMIF